MSIKLNSHVSLLLLPSVPLTTLVLYSGSRDFEASLKKGIGHGIQLNIIGWNHLSLSSWILRQTALLLHPALTYSTGAQLCVIL